MFAANCADIARGRPVDRRTTTTNHAALEQPVELRWVLLKLPSSNHSRWMKQTEFTPGGRGSGPTIERSDTPLPIRAKTGRDFAMPARCLEGALASLSVNRSLDAEPGSYEIEVPPASPR